MHTQVHSCVNEERRGGGNQLAPPIEIFPPTGTQAGPPLNAHAPMPTPPHHHPLSLHREREREPPVCLHVPMDVAPIARFRFNAAWRGEEEELPLAAAPGLSLSCSSSRRPPQPPTHPSHRAAPSHGGPTWPWQGLHGGSRQGKSTTRGGVNQGAMQCHETPIPRHTFTHPLSTSTHPSTQPPTPTACTHHHSS